MSGVVEFEALGAIAPMLLAFDRQLVVRHLGHGWAAAAPDAAPGQPLSELVRFVRPDMPFDFDEIRRRGNASLLIEVRASGLPLRGQLVETGDQLVFLGRAWVTHPTDLTRYGLTLADVPLADRDYLFVLQTKDATIADAAKLAERLAEQRAEQRQMLVTLAAQFSVTRTLAEARTLDEGAAPILEALCDVLGWSHGAMWRVDRRATGQLIPVATWVRAGADTAFAEVTSGCTFVRGQGVPGRVWETAETIWIDDVAGTLTAPRGPAAAAAGLKGAVVIPVLASEGRDVAGVIELFGAESRQPDAQVLALLASFSSQLGQFLDRRRSEQALRDSEERTRLIIESALDAVVTIDGQGLVRAWNQQAERTFGWTADEALGRELGELIVPPEAREAHRAGLQRYATTRRSDMFGRRLELVALDRHGRRFPVELSIAPVHRAHGRGDEPGPPMLYSGFIRDITARKEAEGQLRQAKEAAEAAAAAKSDFLATMSHEIRTPMNAVIGLTGLLLDTTLDETQRRWAETVRGAGESLLTIINDILDFSKIEAGRLELESVAFSPGDLLSDVQELFGPVAAAKGVTLDVEIEPAVPARVVADPGRLRQILTNLVSNALKFTPEGRVHVALGLERPDARGLLLSIRVTDTGIGIEPSARPRLFSPFSQADSSMTRRFGGTGLGLAICERLTRLMGGTIHLDSEVGRGSTFIATVHVGEALGGTERPHGIGEPPAMAKGLVRALVVEDNPANQLVAVAMLKRLGVRCDSVGDGAEAIEAVARQPYDVVLMDCQMPGIDGYEAARRIRLQPGPRVPIIAMTANALIGERERCLAAGMDDYLPKPVRIRELSEALSRWARGFDQASAATGAAEAPARPVDDFEGVRSALGEQWNAACDVFADHSRKVVQEMAEAADAGASADLGRLAHTLRGGCDMMGARSVSALIREIELGIRAGGPGPFGPAITALAAALEQSITGMRSGRQ